MVAYAVTQLVEGWMWVESAWAALADPTISQRTKLSLIWKMTF